MTVLALTRDMIWYQHQAAKAKLQKTEYIPLPTVAPQSVGERVE
jgi:hypothetical protein